MLYPCPLYRHQNICRAAHCINSSALQQRSRNRREGIAMASNQSMRSPLPGPAALSPDKAAEVWEIVVFIDGRTETAGILEFAGELAEEHGARLISVFMQPTPTVTPAETFARGKG